MSRSDSSKHSNNSARSRRWAHWVGRNLARFHYARRIEPTWVEVNSVEVPVVGLPAALDGFRVVQLSDFHLKRRLDPSYIRQCVDLANRCEPHLVALTGDFVHKGFHYVAEIADLVANLQAPCGIFAVLGNHDHSVRNRLGLPRHRRLHLAVEEALLKRGIRVLRNDATVVEHHNASLVVAGLDDLWSRRCDVPRTFASVAADLPRIVLAHNPKSIELLGSHRCDLMLSGHTHGGQVSFTGWRERLWGPRRFRSGLYLHEGKYLYVNKGVGHGLPLRYRTRPEVALLRLVQPRERTR